MPGCGPGWTWRPCCAGITTYSPLRKWKVGKGQKVGVVGLGGLGHMGVKFADAFRGPTWSTFTTSPGRPRTPSGWARDEVVVARNAGEMQKHAGSFDFILDTVSADHDINAYLHLLRPDGNLTLVGAPSKLPGGVGVRAHHGPAQLSGSPIGASRDAGDARLLQEAQHHVGRRVIPIQRVNRAYERLLKSDVKYRFCIDMASLKAR